MTLVTGVLAAAVWLVGLVVILVAGFARMWKRVASPPADDI
jgi:hypothetical protein